MVDIIVNNIDSADAAVEKIIDEALTDSPEAIKAREHALTDMLTTDWSNDASYRKQAKELINAA